MRYILLMIVLFSFPTHLWAQEREIAKTRFIGGLSGPELIHAGITHRVASASQFGLNVGAGPSMGLIWSAISLEHRLYIGKDSRTSHQKTWFFRQGTTFFPSARKPQQFTLNFTFGKDIPFKNSNNGLTVDLGVFHLPDSESSALLLSRSLNLWPALRFQIFFTLKRPNKP